MPGVLNKETLLKMLDQVGREIATRGRTAEIALYGGSAMMLCFNTREATKDADYVPISGDPALLRRAINKTARAFDAPPDWMNDSVQIFQSDASDHDFLGDFPADGAPGLRVFVASPRYLFAMKALALRNPFETTDLRDTWDLIDICEFETADDALALVDAFYPHKISRRNELILRDVFDAKAQNKAFSPALGW